MIFYPTLFEASSARQVEWCAAAPMSLSYFSNELGGEAGEVLELWEEISSVPDEDTYANLADELGDVVICTINIAIKTGITVKGYALPSEDVSTSTLFIGLGADVGVAQNIVKKLEREQLGLVGSRATPNELMQALNTVLVTAYTLAGRFDIDLEAATRAKFNKTSSKYGLQTMVLH
ncbi:hypothetical protein [Sphingobium sp. MK2]|uniref:hypothetical protein n=1 Tax=Sphingobium sp. MK2 TaxID=3116540 RepID=UPI0032E35F4E